MASTFTLQPGLTRLAPSVLQPGCDNTFAPYPIYDSRPNYSSRPVFAEFGHAPYMAGKGVPAELILVDDALRPQSTKRFGKVQVEPFARNLFPLQNNLCLGTPQVSQRDPSSTRAQLQNTLFHKRYPTMKPC